MLPSHDAVLLREFLVKPRPAFECHASTIEEGTKGLVAAWFGGTHEGAPDVGIWLTRQVRGRWTEPKEVVRPNGHPCWNPVLFQAPSGPLMLFYKAGPNPRHWWGMLMTSRDGGARWSKPKRLPAGILGPIKNRPMALRDGAILCPTSDELDGWKVSFDLTRDLGKSWTKIGPVNDGHAIEAIQPSLLDLGGGRLRAVGRTQQDRIFEIDSSDEGATWGSMRLGELPNNNSGTDATSLKQGGYLMVYNHTPRASGAWSGKRSPLNVAISKDGEHWRMALELEDEPGAEFSYPSLIQTKDGLVHIVYTWKRQSIRHVVIDPSRL